MNLVGGAEEVEPPLVQLDRKEKMTYTEQAAKRKHCQRLTRQESSVHCVHLYDKLSNTCSRGTCTCMHIGSMYM